MYCRYCQGSGKLGSLQQLLYCDGIWLHALLVIDYKLYGPSYSCLGYQKQLIVVLPNSKFLQIKKINNCINLLTLTSTRPSRMQLFLLVVLLIKLNF